MAPLPRRRHPRPASSASYASRPPPNQPHNQRQFATEVFRRPRVSRFRHRFQLRRGLRPHYYPVGCKRSRPHGSRMTPPRDPWRRCRFLALYWGVSGGSQSDIGCGTRTGGTPGGRFWGISGLQGPFRPEETHEIKGVACLSLPGRAGAWLECLQSCCFVRAETHEMETPTPHPMIPL